MLAALRTNGSFHWFITRNIFFRRFGGNMNGSSHDYESFHAMTDPDLNPFGPLLFQDEVPEYAEVPIWECEEEIYSQYFNNDSLTRFKEHHYSREQLEHFVIL